MSGPPGGVDLDRVVDVAKVVGMIVFVLAGTIGGALTLGWMFGVWAGFLLMLGVGLLIGVAWGRQAHDRRVTRKDQAAYAAKFESTFQPPKPASGVLREPSVSAQRAADDVPELP